MSAEFDLIDRFFSRRSRRALLGVGDDCALWQAPAGMACAVSTDMLVEGRHFEAGVDAESLGHKALAVNLSDLAAIGADPAYALLALALPSIEESWLQSFAHGLFTLADQHGVELIGGDTTRGPLCLCITVIGHVPADRALRRDGARPGDDVWVSGTLGDAALALSGTGLSGEAARFCRDRLDRPQPRMALGQRLRELAHSAIDISDGLAADLAHVARASGVAIDIAAESLPKSAALASCADRPRALECQAAGGDDYELAFTASVSNREAIGALGRELSLPLTRIGTVREGHEVRILDLHGEALAFARAGFDHFES
jgi:thiamine-monophosphate kinase